MPGDRQVMTFHRNGTVSGLQRKPGQGFDLRKLGTASIKRASEIVWNEETQKWYVQILVGKYAGKRITPRMCLMASQHTHISNADTAWPQIEFAEYDDAVKAEIYVLDHIRLTEGAQALSSEPAIV